MLKNVPLKSLRFFESAARNLSFKLASDELNVTPAAVGQQIKTLEEFLGVRLFERLTRAIALTAEGQRIFPGVRDGLQKIENTLDTIQFREDNGTLGVTTVHSFAAKWLFPRLSKFSLRHPDVDVRLTATRKVLNFTKDHIDIAIRIAAKDPKTNELNSIKLFDESFIPVCSPDLLLKSAPLRTPDDLRYHTLIHDDSMVIYHDCDWKDWLNKANVKDIDTSRGPRFNPSTMPIQAALNGLGFALARKSLIRDDLKSGLLVTPFSFEIPSKAAYYLVYPKKKEQLENIHLFRDWILEEVSDLC